MCPYRLLCARVIKAFQPSASAGKERETHTHRERETHTHREKAPKSSKRRKKCEETGRSSRSGGRMRGWQAASTKMCGVKVPGLLCKRPCSLGFKALQKVACIYKKDPVTLNLNLVNFSELLYKDQAKVGFTRVTVAYKSDDTFADDRLGPFLTLLAPCTSTLSCAFPARRGKERERASIHRAHMHMR